MIVSINLTLVLFIDNLSVNFKSEKQAPRCTLKIVINCYTTIHLSQSLNELKID